MWSDPRAGSSRQEPPAMPTRPHRSRPNHSNLDDEDRSDIWDDPGQAVPSAQEPPATPTRHRGSQHQEPNTIQRREESDSVSINVPAWLRELATLSITITPNHISTGIGSRDTQSTPSPTRRPSSTPQPILTPTSRTRVPASPLRATANPLRAHAPPLAHPSTSPLRTRTPRVETHQNPNMHIRHLLTSNILLRQVIKLCIVGYEKLHIY